MATEDFTTYTESDPNTVRTVTASKIAVVDMPYDDEGYVIKDAGADHFGDFEHLIDSQHDGDASNNSRLHFWHMSNSATPEPTTNPCFYCSNYYFSPNLQIILHYYDGSDNSDSYAYGTSFGVLLYHKIERSGTTITNKIYSDSSRTTLLDTLSVAAVSTAFRYIASLVGHNAFGDTPYVSGFSQNLDLQEAPPVTFIPKFMGVI